MPGSKTRHFGNVRRLPSGRYQARYRGPDARMRSAPQTFARKGDAARWLTNIEAEIHRGDWIDPDLARVSFGEYAEQWVSDRVLKFRTEELYRALLRNHLLPFSGNVRLADIDEAAVRRWRKERLDAGPAAPRPFGPVTVAKAYRLMHAIYTTAVEDDRLVRRNPCRIEGAGKEDSPERDIAPLPVALAIADALPVRYRALALLATFTSLRWGELVGLRRENIDLEACEIRVVETTAEPDRGSLRPETPKSRAGGARTHSPLIWPLNCAGTWSGSPSRGSGAWSSSAPRALHCDGRAFGRSGTRPALRLALPTCTSTT